MKKLILSGAVVCSLLIIGTAAFAGNTAVNRDRADTVVRTNPDPQDDLDPVRAKSFSRTFPVDHTDKISLSNQFGSMIIKVWERKEVKIDVKVSAFSNNEKEAQRLIDGVEITAGKSGDLISCRTTISRERGWSGRNRKREIKVNYVVYLPAANSLTLSQEFGNVNLDDFSGPLYAKVQYGDFNAGNLAGTNNYISVQYGKTNIIAVNKAIIKQQYGPGLVLGTAGTLDLDAQYVNVAINTIKGDGLIKQQYGSGLKIGAVNNLDLDVQYANVNIGTIRGNAIVKQQYNALAIGTVGKLNLKSEYTGVVIGSLKGDGNFRMSYNSLKIAEISPACKNLTVDADYVDMSLDFADGYNGDFMADNSYAAFKYGANVKARTTGDNDDSSTKKYLGKIGNGGGAVVRIKAEYGAVVFK